MLSGVTTCDQITYADRTVQGYSEEPYATGFVGVYRTVEPAAR